MGSCFSKQSEKPLPGARPARANAARMRTSPVGRQSYNEKSFSSAVCEEKSAPVTGIYPAASPATSSAASPAPSLAASLATSPALSAAVATTAAATIPVPSSDPNNQCSIMYAFPKFPKDVLEETYAITYNAKGTATVCSGDKFVMTIRPTKGKSSLTPETTLAILSAFNMMKPARLQAAASKP